MVRCVKLGLLRLLLLLLELHLHDLHDALGVLLLALDRLLERVQVLLHKVGLGLVVRVGLCPGLQKTKTRVSAWPLGEDSSSQLTFLT